jgi:predicted DNA-binding transcriptional regulator YafY
MGKKKQSTFHLMHRVLTRLNGHPGMTSVELADALETDLRNIQNYIRRLQSYGFDIQTDESQVPFRHSFRDRLPTMPLDLEETLALAMSVPLSDASGLGSAARRGWDKLSSVVANGRERRTKAEMNELLSSQFGWSASAEVMTAIGTALVDKRQLRILYRNRDAVQASWRIIEPWQMFFQGGWYLRGWDAEKKAVRSFRPDRIEKFELLTSKFEVPPSERAADPHFHKWDIGAQEPTRVHCQVDEALSRWLAENPVHPSQQLDGTDFSVAVRDVDALMSWILGLSHCRVVGPESACNGFKQRLKNILSVINFKTNH